MPIDLYYVPGSSPCRAVRLVAAAVGVELNLKLTDLMAKEHLKPEFIKMNPQHTLPTLDDNGFYLWESRAICTYLIDKYSQDDSLYPKDPKQRAIINQRLYFDLDCLYNSFADYLYPQMFGGAPADPEKLKKCYESLDTLEKFLEGRSYVAADHMTVADLALVTSVSNFTIIDFDLTPYKNTLAWLDKIKAEAPNYEGTNGEGLKAFEALKKQLMK
ncbi:glutathione S-transferase 1-like [Phymastichus coffea]|uniref:glutathione S-transferase 1-like n=1 Tax=Phymastichus coffea TaxID=108790 RepID=UPI00273CEE3D|nr:glutathione S-transferase 1-like [Phymastichus coffea]